MDVIFTDNVSEEGQRIVKTEREREREREAGWSFCLWSILLAL